MSLQNQMTDERRCTAIVKNGPNKGNRCTNPARKNQRVCRMHGGNAPRALAAAARRGARNEALGHVGELLEEMGELPIPDPLTGLEIAYAKSAQMLAALGILVAQRDSLLGENRFEELVVHPLTALYGEWLDRYARVQKMALDAGVDERRTSIAEADTERLFTAVVNALEAAGLTPEQEATFRASLAANLTAIAA